MRLRAILGLVPVLTAIAVASRADWVRADNANSMLVAAPQEGHPGDTFYLSASHLTPRKRVYVLMACPNWYDHNMWTLQNYRFEQNGPVTDAQGSFRAFPFQVLTPHGFKNLPVACTIYISDGIAAFGPDFPANYLILPPHTLAHKIWRRPWVRVKTSPVRVRSGLYESVTVESWPGADADVTVSYPGATPVLRHLSLNLKGWARYRFQVNGASLQPVRAQVQVRLRIGSRASSGSGEFMIVR